MTWHKLRIATIFMIIQSLLFFPAPVSRAQDHPTEAEISQAHGAADLFMRLLEETGDFSHVIDEMYAGDFIERYLQKQIRDGAESDSSSGIDFAPGLNYKRDLLKQATKEDWRGLYIAANNFIFHVMISCLNKHADDLMNDREIDEEAIQKSIPPNVIALFNKQPALKGFFGLDLDIDLDIDKDDKPGAGESAGEKPSDASEEKSGPRPIETSDEMREVTKTLQESLRLLHEEQGDHSLRLTESGKRALAVVNLQLEELMGPTIEVSDKEFMGLAPGTRVLNVPTPFMFWLQIAEVNGRQQIVWAQLLGSG